MLVPYHTTPTTPSNAIASAFNISTSANLKITMKISTQSEPKKRTRYRPVERQDGVVVLQRPYRPSASTPQLAKFEKHIPVFASSTRKSKPRTSAALKRTEEDVVGMGAQFAEMGKDGYNNLMDAGRDGYNDLLDAGRGSFNELHLEWTPQEEAIDEREDILAVVRHFSNVAQRPRLSPMQRFHNERGAWSPHGLRES
jgi:hypothetical protein